ncbi:IPT/TIG domain-containing protein [Williamwhitmania taraxaci]|nr:IPT/TIG domain-containing protein [Williamwhitmania taraxaci]
MKRLLFFTFAIAIGLGFWSCDKDDGTTGYKRDQVEWEITGIKQIPGRMAVVSCKMKIVYLNDRSGEPGNYIYRKIDFWTCFDTDTSFSHEKETTWNIRGIKDGVTEVEFSDTVENLDVSTTYYFKIHGQFGLCDTPILNYGGTTLSQGYSPTVKMAVEKPVLAVSSIAPLTGTYRDTVTIKGAGFSKVCADNKVLFNGMEATVAKAYYDSLKVLVPKKAGAGEVTVKVGSESTSGGKFDYVHEPYVVYTIMTCPGILNDFGKIEYDYLYQITVDGNNNVIALMSNTIIKISQDGKFITIAGQRGVYGCKDGNGATALFSNSRGIIVDNGGDYIVTDGSNHCIRRVKADGSSVLTFSGEIGKSGYEDGVGGFVKYNVPTCIAQSSTGEYFIADRDNRRIRKYGNDGWVSTFAGSGKDEFVEGQGYKASIGEPKSMVRDSKDNLFVASSTYPHGFTRILKITPSGVVSILSQSTFAFYPNLTIDGQDNIYSKDFTCTLNPQVDC